MFCLKWGNKIEKKKAKGGGGSSNKVGSWTSVGVCEEGEC